MTHADSPVKVTIVVDNSAPAGLAAEHGLSLWLELGEKRIVFDTGQGELEIQLRAKNGNNIPF